MEIQRSDVDVRRVATLDIETTHLAPAEGEVVAIGIGLHQRGRPGKDATYECFFRSGRADEAETILAAVRALDAYEADRLVTFNGEQFDVPFLQNRLAANAVTDFRIPFVPDRHLDLFRDRKRRADELDEKWPSLEECMETYGVTPAKTYWKGAELTNGRFGNEVGPAYLEAASNGEEHASNELRSAMDHYLRSDLEGNFVVYYGDIGVEFDPIYLGTRSRF